MIYFDNAATSFPKPEEVYTKMDFINRHLSVNAGRGEYSLAFEAETEIEYTRNRVASLMGVQSDSVFFTPSNTIAMNMIIQGLVWDNCKNVYVTPFEHNAVMRVLEILRSKRLCKIIVLSFSDKTYLPDLEEISRQFATANPDYIFINHASNVIGKIVDVIPILDIAKQYGAISIIDLAQTLGAIDVKPVVQKADFSVFAGHKCLLGPIGVGGFVDNSNLILQPVLAGGNGSDSRNIGMPQTGNLKFEIGSQNIVAIAGLGAGIDFVMSHTLQKLSEHKTALIQYFLNKVNEIPKVSVFQLHKSDYALGLVSFIVDGYESADVGKILNDEYDIAVRTGFHCAPLIHDFLNTLEYGGTVRISFGYFNSIAEVDILLEALKSL